MAAIDAKKQRATTDERRVAVVAYQVTLSRRSRTSRLSVSEANRAGRTQVLMLRRRDGLHRDRKRLRIVLVACGMILVLVIVALAVWTRAHGPVDEASLVRSVERASGSAGMTFDVDYGCTENGGGAWQCRVLDSSASGTATYDVIVSDGSCWDGTLVEPVSGLILPRNMPRTISGCTLLRD